jgi:hypothetical protein
VFDDAIWFWIHQKTAMMCCIDTLESFFLIVYYTIILLSDGCYHLLSISSQNPFYRGYYEKNKEKIYLHDYVVMLIALHAS